MPEDGEFYSNNVFEGTEKYPELKKNGKYRRVHRGEPAFNVQDARVAGKAALNGEDLENECREDDTDEAED